LRGTRPPYRALAGLTLASARFGRGLFMEARTIYTSMVRAPWAADVRPQVLLGAAKCATELRRNTENQAFLAQLVKDYPDTEEAAEARLVLKVPARAKIWVQVGAFSRVDFADSEKAKWVAKGYRAALGVSRHGSLKLNAVLLGPYATKLEADKVARTLKAAGTGAFVTRY
jgi:cell division protein FtsN